MMRTFVRLAALLAFIVAALPALVAPAFAAEEILSFDSGVKVEKNGDLIVTETIRVHVESDQIRRGIYRDFPTTHENPEGGISRNSFELLSVRRDGQSESYRTESGGNFVRVYFGRADFFLPHGVHTYELIYRSDRQIRFFRDHDEVYWNATGTEWVFPILEATAEIRLPEGALAMDAKAYTGGYGSTSENARYDYTERGNVVRFETTRPLGPRQGLSVVVAFPKGFIAEPSFQQKLAWFFRDHKGAILAFVGLVVVFGYYIIGWLRVGRDPPRDIVVPRWDLPQGVSPALTHYIYNRGLKKQGFTAISAAALNLAVKGYIVLEDIGKTVSLRRTDKKLGAERLPTGESILYTRLSPQRTPFKIDKANGTMVASLGNAFRSGMAKEHRASFYQHNGGWIAGGIALSAIFILAILFVGGINGETVGAIIPIVFFGIILTVMTVTVSKRASSGLGGKLRFVFMGFFIVVMLINSGALAVAGLWGIFDDPLLIGSFVSLVLVNILFFFLMGAPTPLGQKRMAEIEGLKRYLTVAEKDRMNMAGAPQMSPSHYETLLPYAVALGVEEQWSKAFQAWLVTAAAAGVAAAATYHGPSWYRGRDPFDTGTIGNRMGGLANSMADSFTASLPRPKSSSSGFSSGGGGGGFSGGGGGGGGGGGW